MTILKFGKPISHSRGLKAHLDYLDKEKPGVESDARRIVFDSTGLYDKDEIAGSYNDVLERHSKNDPDKHPNVAYTASLSFDPADLAAQNLTDNDMEVIGKEIASRVAPGHEYVIAVHRDEPHPHLHLTWSSINSETGKMYHRSKSQFYSLKRDLTYEIQEQYGLRKIEFLEKDHKSPDKQTDGEYRLREKGEYVWKDDLKDRIDECKNGQEEGFEGRLKKLGVEIQNKKYRGTTYQSYQFTDNCGKVRTIKTSKIGTSYDIKNGDQDVDFKRDYKNIDMYLKDSLGWARANAKSLNHYKHLLKSRDIKCLSDKRKPDKFKYFWKGQGRREDYKSFGSKVFTKGYLSKYFDDEQQRLREIRKQIGKAANRSRTIDDFSKELKRSNIDFNEKNGKWQYSFQNKSYDAKKIGKWADRDAILLKVETNEERRRLALEYLNRRNQQEKTVENNKTFEKAGFEIGKSIAAGLSYSLKKSKEEEEEERAKKIRKQLGIEF